MQRNLDRGMTDSDDVNIPPFTYNVTSMPRPRRQPCKRTPSVDHRGGGGASEASEQRAMRVQTTRQALLCALETPEESQHRHLLDIEHHAISHDIET